MAEAPAAFTAIIRGILDRFFRQNDQPAPPAAAGAAFADRLHALLVERGLPRPLAPDESGQPGGMAEAECAPLVARVAGADAPPLLAEAAKQLVKACFYPEFRICRDSFRECASDGACRRQQLARVRSRISGSHCVDCPHWVALGPEAHAELLARHWADAAGAEEFRARQAVFLPEDFRALRLWLHAAARSAAGGAA